MENLQTLFYYLLPFIGLIMATSLGLSMLLLVWVVSTVRGIDIPEDADFPTALRATPLVVVIMLDLLDLGLDFMSAPVGWAILTYLGLRPLRGITVVEGLLPFTGVIPTMTVAWITVRVMGDKI